MGERETPDSVRTLSGLRGEGFLVSSGLKSREVNKRDYRPTSGRPDQSTGSYIGKTCPLVPAAKTVSSSRSYLSEYTL